MAIMKLSLTRVSLGICAVIGMAVLIACDVSNLQAAAPPRPRTHAQSQQPLPPQFRGKFGELGALIREKSAHGQDVAKARLLGIQAREAAMAGETQKAQSLLDQAFALLGVATTERPAEASASPRTLNERTISILLPVSSDHVVVTRAVPALQSGAAFRSQEQAFPSEHKQALDGNVELAVSSVPIYVEESSPATPAITKEIILESPFGGTPTPTVPHFDVHYKEIGARWLRYSGRFMAWDVVEAERGYFDWSMPDSLASETTANGVELFFTVKSYHRVDQPNIRFRPGRHAEPNMPNDLQGYLEFLQRAVERYDGDGVDDAPGSPVVNVWQIENEVDGLYWGDTPENYAQLLKSAYRVVTAANPSARVLIAGVSRPSGFQPFYVPVLHTLSEIRDQPRDRYFDVFDFHWFGSGGEYDRLDGQSLADFLSTVRKTLSEYGYADTPIWTAETGTYSGSVIRDPRGKRLPEQNETVHASELVRRYAHFIANSVEKVFWLQMEEIEKGRGSPGEAEDYFAGVGLINNPRNDGQSFKKLAYYSYQLMVDKLEGSDWNQVERLDLGPDIYAYRFPRNGGSTTVVWHGN